MRPPRPVPPELSAAPFDRATALRHVTRHMLAGPAFQRLTRGGYWLAGQPVDHGRLIQAMRAVLPPDAVLRGVSAAWALGVPWAGPDDPVEVVRRHEQRVRSRPGLQVSGDRLLPGETTDSRFGPTTGHARTAYDLARRLALPRGVAAIDAVLRVGSVPVDDLLAVIANHPGARGVRRAGQAAALADPRSESPRESMLRVALIEAGLPAPVPQFEVWSGGRLVARLDLAWPEYQVGMEYDGAHHREYRQHSRDLSRHNELRALGWVVFQVDGPQLQRFDPVLDRLRTALAGRSVEDPAGPTV